MAAQRSFESWRSNGGVGTHIYGYKQMQWEYAKLSGAPEADELQKKQEELMPQIQENAAAAAYLQSTNALEPNL